MRTSRQFVGTLGPRGTRRWFTHSWPANWHVIWYMVPITPLRGGPSLDWDVEVERASSTHVTYWLTVRNRTFLPIQFEGRYAVLNA